MGGGGAVLWGKRKVEWGGRERQGKHKKTIARSIDKCDLCFEKPKPKYADISELPCAQCMRMI